LGLDAKDLLDVMAERCAGHTRSNDDTCVPDGRHAMGFRSCLMAAVAVAGQLNTVPVFLKS